MSAEKYALSRHVYRRGRKVLYHSLNSSSDSINGVLQFQWKIIFIYIFFFNSPTGQTGEWIFKRGSSKNEKSRHDVPIGVIELKIPYLLPKIVKKN